MRNIKLLPFALFAVFAAIPILIAVFGTVDEGPPRRGGMEQFTLIERPRPVPDTPFRDGSGRKITLNAFAGKVALVNFWATWCAPCLREMPSLDRLAARRAGDDFAVVAISVDRDGAEKARPFLEKLGLENLALYLDPGMELARALGVKGLPTTMLVDRRGRVVGRLDGVAEWDTPEVEALLDYYLEK